MAGMKDNCKVCKLWFAILVWSKIKHHTFLTDGIDDAQQRMSYLLVTAKTCSGLQTCQKLRRWWSEQTKLMKLEFKRTSGWFGSLPKFSK